MRERERERERESFVRNNLQLKDTKQNIKNAYLQ